MKVGTDSILLGAWTHLEGQPKSILDIGAGTGILSLILAQRSDAQFIDAIEIDDLAHSQCNRNYEQSPWSSRLICHQSSLEQFAQKTDDQYDLIICNPPFYSEDYKSQNTQRDLARFQDAMPFQQLLRSVATLLSDKGKFSVIIPYSEESNFITLAAKSALYPLRITRTRGTPTSDIKRSLLEFSFTKVEVLATELIIEISRHHYTEDFKKMTKDLYLNM